MARGAGERGLPLELPVMAGLAESGLRNLRGTSYHGFFGMHKSLNAGDYRGFPRNPTLQLDWFLDTAALVRQRRVAEGGPDPAADAGDYGLWIADVERPAPENRSGYQPHLDGGAQLIGGRCPAPVRSDLDCPRRCACRVARRQRALASDGIVTRLRCPAEACMAGIVATLTAAGRELTLRAPAIDPASTWSSVLIRLPSASGASSAGPRLPATVTVYAADAAANAVSATRTAPCCIP